MALPALPAHSPRIEVTPARALVDTPLVIRLSGLAPAQPVTIRATLHHTLMGSLESAANFLAGQTGSVDLAHDAPQAGSYAGVDAMGLFWSMLPAAAPVAPPPAPDDPTLSPLTVHLTAEIAGTAIATAVVERRWLADGVRVAEVRERGLAGRLLLPPGPGPHPGVILLGGSGGGLALFSDAALASRGFAVLSLAYFGYADLPPALTDIPLEYFATAVTWLQEQPTVRSGGVGVAGMSRGGELALLLGATFPAVRVVVGLVPSHVVWPGLGGTPGAPAWTYHGQPVPMMPPREPSAAPSLPAASLSLTPRFLADLTDKAAEARAAIAVEQIQGPVLLISGKDDALWPSTLMAGRVLTRLRAHHHPYPDEHWAYDAAGHSAVGPPYLPSTPRPAPHPVTGQVYALGGTAAGVARARADAWPRLLSFLHAHL